MKPKGGRGKKAPYETKLMRVPVPMESQVEELSARYREFVAAGGNPEQPPSLLESPRGLLSGDTGRAQQETPPSMLESRLFSGKTGRAQLLLGVRSPGVRGDRRSYAGGNRHDWGRLVDAAGSVFGGIGEGDQQHQAADRSQTRASPRTRA
ncbi:hypothetical protein NG799_26425 [Laspinema sp. D1]|uniref:Transposase n=1 Tax=Laspinema palackyanum D2a TaxID=2953684 RepID=A0ABT2N139_9CYAN|nr:hypothetical protein [Laspinema sp. D2a]